MITTNATLFLVVSAMGCTLLAIVLLAAYVGRLHHRVNRLTDEQAQVRQRQWQEAQMQTRGIQIR